MPNDWEYMFDVDAWARDGLMTPDIILKRLTDCMRGDSDSTREIIMHHFNRYSDTTTEPNTLPQSALPALFAASDSPLTLFPEVTPILYRSLLYAAGIPFHNFLLGPQDEPSPPLTLAQFRRALGWLLPSDKYLVYPMGSRCRARTPADERRVLFQSLARGTDGKRLPHDEDEARRRAMQRAFELPWWRKSELDYAQCNRDDEGDEMFHHLLEVLGFCMPWDWDDYIPFAQPNMEKFIPLARELHGDEVRLHHLSIDQADFRALARWLVFSHVVVTGIGEEERLRGLDEVAECVVRTFCRDARAGITYEMFEDGCAMLPTAFYALDRVLLDVVADSDDHDFPRRVVPHFGRILTAPVFGLLTMMLLRDMYFGRFTLRDEYSWDVNQMEGLDATGLERMIRGEPRQGVFLVSGTDPSTGDRVVFGVFVLDPVEDGRAITPAQEPYGDEPVEKSTLLFQLSPVVRRFDGILGRPGWSVRDGDLVFGEPGHGAALVLDECLSMGVFTQDVGGDDQEVYRTVPWGTRQVTWEVESIEIWVDRDGDPPQDLDDLE
ncbi:uncharacterized protein BDW47DRAFT_132517 [Aspergillus candidus]|uniref:Uncharacterized protein n=1 Tax=Aspergillus candidus TaxID=41067 RepID=A0A2I2F8G5_ASPCN|nr:hypothetical protein BDW47DRAFT_132517 [Aspergillus candidus]PLB36920.1 hypothetical protein BDW47DRAFT_132517 [Aspergillus candidus]